MNKNFWIDRYTLLEIIITIEYSLKKKYLNKGVKKSNPCYGERVLVLGKLGSKLGNSIGKLLKDRKDVR